MFAISKLRRVIETSEFKINLFLNGSGNNYFTLIGKLIGVISDVLPCLHRFSCIKLVAKQGRWCTFWMPFHYKRSCSPLYHMWLEQCWWRWIKGHPTQCVGQLNDIRYHFFYTVWIKHHSALEIYTFKGMLILSYLALFDSHMPLKVHF